MCAAPTSYWKGQVSVDAVLNRGQNQSHPHSAFSNLIQQARASQLYWQQIRSLIPDELATHIAPGPVIGQTWRLLARNNAVASKLKQLLPRIQAELTQHSRASSSWSIERIDIRVCAW
jgi:hypothetical protein